jgi:hypothetical protein
LASWLNQVNKRSTDRVEHPLVSLCFRQFPSAHNVLEALDFVKSKRLLVFPFASIFMTDDYMAKMGD